MAAKPAEAPAGLVVESVPIDSLTPHPDNPRRGDVTTIAESLTASGQVKPIVVAADGVILAGNHTWQAAVGLGWTSIDIVRRPYPHDAPEARRFMLADNRTSDLGSYDDAALAAVLQALADDDAGLLGTGYLADDLTDLLHLTQVRTITADGEGSGFSMTALATDGVIPDKGKAARTEDYSTKAIRSVILAYDLVEFDEVTNLMAHAREVTGTESNAEAVLAVLRDV